MSPHALVLWAILAALVIILVLAGIRAGRALGELKRLSGRVDAMADLPVVKALTVAERDLGRLEAALGRIGPLIARAETAFATIRRGPVPPELMPALRRVGTAFGALRSLARR